MGSKEMIQLEELKPNVDVRGILPNGLDTGTTAWRLEPVAFIQVREAVAGTVVTFEKVVKI